MASFYPCVKNHASGYIFYVSLVSQASTKVFQSTPTIAAGDFKVSIDGGSLTNLGTLPTVTPAASKMVKITLSQAEINGDNITVVCSDAAGAEWCDLTINIQTVPRRFDDLAFPLTSGRGILVDTNGYVTEVSVDGIQKNTALSNFEFPMRDSADHWTLKTGLATITAERSIDGASFAACANAASEVGTTGIYKINLAATDLNGDVITFKFTATGADATLITIKTNS
jgi:hypothetical protein